MRVTIDLDTKSKFALFKTLFRGCAYFMKIPEIRETAKGYHIIWRGLNITEEQCYTYRYKLGDDKKRIQLDMCSDKRIKQVLFREKVVTYYGYSHRKMFDTKGHRNKCPMCGKAILEGKIIWTDAEKCKKVIHLDGSECVKLFKS